MISILVGPLTDLMVHSPSHRGSSFPAVGTESQTGSQHKMSVLMCADHMHVSDGVLLQSGLLQRNHTILQVRLWRCAGYDRESNLFDLENRVDEGLRPYIRRGVVRHQ